MVTMLNASMIYPIKYSKDAVKSVPYLDLHLEMYPTVQTLIY